MSRRFNMGVRCVGIALVTVFSFYMAMACGGGGGSAVAPQDTPAAPVTIAVSGTVSGITATANVSATKSIKGKKDVSDTTGAGLSVTCYTLDGTSLGSVTSSADGTFSIDADLDFLATNVATDGSWSASIICTAKSDDGKVDFKTVYSFNGNTSTKADVSVGTINVDSTLTAASLGGDLGCDLAVGSKCTVPTGMNLGCAAVGLGAAWSQVSDTTNTGDFSFLAGMLKSASKNLYKAGINWADLGCKTATTCIKQFMDCTLSDTDLVVALKFLATVAPETVAPDFATNKTGWLQGCVATKAIHDVVASNLAGSADAATVCANITKGDGADHAKVTVQALLAVKSDVQNPGDIALLFQPAAWKILDTAAVNGSGAFMMNYLAKLPGTEGGTASDIKKAFNDMLADGTALDYLRTVAANAPALDAAHQKNYAEGCSQAYKASGPTIVCPNNKCDAAAIGYVTAPFTQDGFDSQIYNYETSKTIFGAMPNFKANDKANVLACFSMANAAAKNNCYVQNFPGNNNNDTGSGNTETCHANLLGVTASCSDIPAAQACEQSYMRLFGGVPLPGASYANHNCNWNGSFCSYTVGPTIFDSACSASGSTGGIYTPGGGLTPVDPVIPLPPSPDSYFEGNWTTIDNCFGGAVSFVAGTGGGLTFTDHNPNNFTCTATMLGQGNVPCSYTSSFITLTLQSGSCILIKQQQQLQPPSLDSYWDGTWYSSNPGCIPNVAVTSNIATSIGMTPTQVGHFDTHTNQGNAGTCAFYNNGSPSVQATGCGYAGAGSDNTPSSDIVISVTGYLSAGGLCSANLAKTPHSYFDGTWYSTTNCYVDSSYALINGQSDKLTISAHNFGFCTANMLGVNFSGCSYTLDGTNIPDSITLTTPGSLCMTSLTKTPPGGGGGGDLPANPTDAYWNGNWVHTKDVTYTCDSQTATIADRQWTVAPGVFITLSKPGSFISADNGLLTLPSAFTVSFSYGRTGGASSNVTTVESGTIIIIPALNTPQGICAMRLVKQ